MAQSVIEKATVNTQDTSFMGSLQRNFHDAMVMTRRNLIHYRRQPQLLAFSTVQPIMFVVLFGFVFGGEIDIPGFDYIDFLIPGILVQTVMFGGTATTVGLADDLSKGLVDRFRTLPMARSAVLAGRTLADTARHFFVVLLMIFVGFLMGFSFHDGAVNAVLSILLITLFGHAMSWVFALMGIFIKDPETAQVAGFVWVFPFVFASSVFVRTDTMPDWLRIFAENQPVTLVVNAARDLMLGLPVGDMPLTLAWIFGIWIVFAFLAVRQYGRTV